MARPDADGELDGLVSGGEDRLHRRPFEFVWRLEGRGAAISVDDAEPGSGIDGARRLPAEEDRARGAHQLVEAACCGVGSWLKEINSRILGGQTQLDEPDGGSRDAKRFGEVAQEYLLKQ